VTSRCSGMADFALALALMSSAILWHWSSSTSPITTFAPSPTKRRGFGRALSSRAAGNQSNFAFEPIRRICLVGLSFPLSVILGRTRFLKGPHRPAIYERSSSSVFQLGCVEALGEPIVDLSDHRRLATIRAARHR